MDRFRTVLIVIVCVLAFAVPAVAIGQSFPDLVGSHGSTRRSAGPARRPKGALVTQSTPVTKPGHQEILRVPVPGMPGTTREVWVYRPPVPDSRDLPVLYFLHGVPSKAEDVFDAGLPHIMDSLFAAGYPPFVLAAPDGNGAHHNDTEWANAVDGSDQIETFVTKNVIDAVEGKNRRDRDRRAIAGFSMGGYGAINLGLRHEELYGQIVPMAGYFHVDDPDGMFGGQLLAIEANTPELHLAAAHRHRIFIVDGDQDNDRVVKGESAQFASQMLAAGIPTWYQQTPGSHSWDFVASAFPNVVMFLDARWSSLRPPPPSLGPGVRSIKGEWQGTVDGAAVDVELPAPKDARIERIDEIREATGMPPTDYALVTLSNPSTATRAFSLAKVSFVDAAGLTIDANPSPITVESWIAAAGTRRQPRGASTDATDSSAASSVTSARLRGQTSTTLPPKLLQEAQALEQELDNQTLVAPGQTKTTVLVTTGIVSSVSNVFVGDSFQDGTLSRTH